MALIGISDFRDSGWQGLDMVNDAMNGKHQLQMAAGLSFRKLFTSQWRVQNSKERRVWHPSEHKNILVMSLFIY